jgi:hypothetical protein
VHFGLADWLATRPCVHNLSAFRGVRANRVIAVRRGGFGEVARGGGRGGRFEGWRAGYPGDGSRRDKSYFLLESEEAQVSAKLGFAAGLAVGLLAGSRAGRGLYDKSAAAASAVVKDPRVRSGASNALHKAGDAGSSVAGAAARRVKNRGKADGEDESADAGDGERDRAALRRRTKRLMGGVRKPGVRVNGHSMRIGRPNLHLHRSKHGDAHNRDQDRDHGGQVSNNNNSHHVAYRRSAGGRMSAGGMSAGGMSAPYVQPKPKKSEGSEAEE